MYEFFYHQKTKIWRKITCGFMAFVFSLSMITIPATRANAQYISTLPAPGTMVLPSNAYQPPILLGLTIDPTNPLHVNFMVDSGQDRMSGEPFKKETQKLVKYYLAALTTPDDQSWVNLSPYEGNRIIPDALAVTEMGKTMLEQDYLLKQLSASLTNPETEIGKKFWDLVYKKAYEKFGTTAVPLNTFNKVWIVPERAEVVEDSGNVYLGETRLKVMMEEDYLSIKENLQNKKFGTDSISVDQVTELNAISSQVVKEIIIPQLEKEVNEGKNFAPVRQIYNSVILAIWFKDSLKESLLGKVYVDKKKVKGIESGVKDIKQKVYDQYLAAFRKGVYNLIKEDYDLASKESLPRKYFSGGLDIQKNLREAMERFSVSPEESRKALEVLRSPKYRTGSIERRELMVELLRTVSVGLAAALVHLVDLGGRIDEGRIHQVSIILAEEIGEVDVITDTVATLAQKGANGKDTLRESIPPALEKLLNKDIGVNGEAVKAGQLLEPLIKQYRSTSGDQRKGIETQIKAIVDRVNVLTFTDAKDWELVKPNLVSDFESNEALAKEYAQKAKEARLEGRYVPQFVFAGAATRFGVGPLYDFRLAGYLQEHNLGPTQPRYAYKLGMGPSQLLAYRLSLEELAQEFGRDINDVLAKQKIILSINSAVTPDVIKDFMAMNFYGFNPDNVILLEQPVERGFSLENGQLSNAEDSAELPSGHGYSAMQLVSAHQGFRIDRQGNVIPLGDRSVVDLLNPDDYVSTHRVNDMEKFSYKTVVDLRKFAYSMYLLSNGNNLTVELVDNPLKTKGGNAIHDRATGRSFLVETLNTEANAQMKEFLKKAGELSAPYNAFRITSQVKTLRTLLREGLPYNIRFKDGYLYVEAVTGDETQKVGARPIFFSNGQVIQDVKEPSTEQLSIARRAIEIQERELNSFGLTPETVVSYLNSTASASSALMEFAKFHLEGIIRSEFAFGLGEKTAQSAPVPTEIRDLVMQASRSMRWMPKELQQKLRTLNLGDYTEEQVFSFDESSNEIRSGASQAVLEYWNGTDMNGGMKAALHKKAEAEGKSYEEVLARWVLSGQPSASSAVLAPAAIGQNLDGLYTGFPMLVVPLREKIDSYIIPAADKKYNFDLEEAKKIIGFARLQEPDQEILVAEFFTKMIRGIDVRIINASDEELAILEKARNGDLVASSSALAGKRILYIEDNEDLGFLTKEFFGEIGAEVTVVKNTSEARVFLNDMDLILLDNDLGALERTGVSFLEDLGKLSNKVPVVLVSENGDARNQAEYLKKAAPAQYGFYLGAWGKVATPDAIAKFEKKFFPANNGNGAYASSALEGQNILYVQGDAKMDENMAALFRKEGARITALNAEDAREAIRRARLAKGSRYTLLLVDNDLSTVTPGVYGGAGMKFLEELATEKDKIPTVVVSEYEELRKAAFALRKDGAQFNFLMGTFPRFASDGAMRQFKAKFFIEEDPAPTPGNNGSSASSALEVMDYVQAAYTAVYSLKLDGDREMKLETEESTSIFRFLLERAISNGQDAVASEIFEKDLNEMWQGIGADPADPEHAKFIMNAYAQLEFEDKKSNGADLGGKIFILPGRVVKALNSSLGDLNRMARERSNGGSRVSSSTIEDQTPDPVGGIDFDPSLLHLQIKRNGKGVPLPLPMQNVEQINIEGLYPVIINIQPATIQNFPFLLGLANVEETPELSMR